MDGTVDLIDRARAAERLLWRVLEDRTGVFTDRELIAQALTLLGQVGR